MKASDLLKVAAAAAVGTIAGELITGNLIGPGPGPLKVKLPPPLPVRHSFYVVAVEVAPGDVPALIDQLVGMAAAANLGIRLTDSCGPLVDVTATAGRLHAKLNPNPLALRAMQATEYALAPPPPAPPDLPVSKVIKPRKTPRRFAGLLPAKKENE